MTNSSTNKNEAETLQQGAFTEWPASLRRLFDGERIETKTGFTASLMAVDQHRVRTALLSVGELLAVDSQTLRLALWPGSRVTQGIQKTGAATLTFVVDETFFQVQLTVQRAHATGETPLACFIASIETGEWQKVGYARLTHGIEFTFAPDQESAVLDRWRAQIDVLKQIA